ncbi:MAG: DUF4261 domain-containing protein [Candidatus Methylacidiphilales bacterium]|nr:DUF4261 domain-containing protein [Candidatus Methylacidiphilales bacterium]
MPKGLISQTVVVLFRNEVTIEELRPFLDGYKIHVRAEAPPSGWEISGADLFLEFRPEVNGKAFIDVVDRPWPDHMGDPQGEPMLFAAWMMGWFGPFAYPRGLKRAIQQCRCWDEAPKIVPSHTAFARIRISYAMGAADDAKCLPEDYEPIPELQFIGPLASRLMQHPQALCFFNPNGELLMPREFLDKSIKHALESKLPPLQLCSNVRLYEATTGWKLMDTIGNWQLDIPDQEAAFPETMCEPVQVDNWLRDITVYILEKGPVIKDGDTMKGPGNTNWQVKSFENGMTDPPRSVMRWLPCGNLGSIPAIFLTEKGEESDAYAGDNHDGPSIPDAGTSVAPRQSSPDAGTKPPWWRFW